jgi:hypothetical protein
MTNSERQEAFKILKEYRIEANKECRGCLSISTYPFKKTSCNDPTVNSSECKFTSSGIPDIPNCPCKNCLIKCTCNHICENFVTQARGYKRCIHYIRDIKIDGRKQYRSGYENAK